VVATYGNGPRENDYERTPGRGEELLDDPIIEMPRLGHDVRFVLAAVGGGAIRIGREVARRHLRYVETVAINCDPTVQDLEEFDRRVCLGPDSGEATHLGGSPSHSAQIARAAMPALERIFEGSTFVTVIGSLGGGAGTGALPYVLDCAARASQVLSVFVVKPFHCEGERRAVADRALGRLHFVESYVEKQERGHAKLQVLDNEALVTRGSSMPFRGLNAHWSEVIAQHIERAFIVPAEAALETHRTATALESLPMPGPVLREPAPPYEPPSPLSPLAPQFSWSPTPGPGAEIELTFEIEGPTRGPDVP
jgi:hypothetical protein